jgi:predicted enzyme related to lactoylglutathione lyase
MISEVSNVWMPVEDIDRAIDFYQNTLGLSMVLREGAWAEFEAHPGLRIGLNGREPGGARVEGGPVLTFQPEGGLEAAIEDLEGRGVEFSAGISEHDWGRVATFKDSEGNNLQLYEPPQG